VQKKSRMKRYSVDALKKLQKNGASRSDWARVGATTDDEIEASVAADPDERGMVVDWASATPVMPQPKAVLNMRVDRDVLEYFRKTGQGYQTRINAVLRAFVSARQRPR
jgi:uncharacterized protein (DUF4415 family)